MSPMLNLLHGRKEGKDLLRDLGLKMVFIASANMLLAIISPGLPLQLQGRLGGGNGYDDHMANVCHKEIVHFGLDTGLFQKTKKKKMLWEKNAWFIKGTDKLSIAVS